MDLPQCRKNISTVRRRHDHEETELHCAGKKEGTLSRGEGSSFIFCPSLVPRCLCCSYGNQPLTAHRHFLHARLSAAFIIYLLPRWPIV